MANPKIKVKRSSVAGKVPQPTQLERGELAINSYDGKVYIVRDQFSSGIGTTTHTVNPWDEYTIGSKIAYAGIASAQQFQGNLTGSVNSSGISTFGGNITVSGTVDGRDISSDGSKLDGIESGATADQTASEIRTLVGSASDSNVFTDALKTKLDNIEAGATGDQTSEEIEDIVGAMLTGNTESGITVTYQDSDGTIDFSVASQTDQNFTNADHSKLDGIEAGATADQTDSEIKTAYENNSDTNAFTDALLSKLNGIESGATGDQTSEEIEDIVGAMLTGNTESGITVTYQDSDGTIDFAVASQTDNNFTNADHSKLDGIESGATADQTASEIVSLLSNQTITTTGDIKVNSISKTVQVGDISGDNYLQLKQENSNSVRGFTNQHSNASVLENLQGTTNQHIVLGDVNRDSSLALFGVSVTQSAQQYARLTLSGTGNLDVHNNITLGGTVDGRDIASDGSKLDGIEAGATNVTNNNQLTNGAGYVTANTQLSNEQVQDIVGGMVSGNTESGITVTYQDGDGTLDFSVASQTDNNFTNADHSKLDGIEAGADVTDATNVNAAGAVMNSDSTTASMSFVIDEDNMSSNSSTKVPTQQSVKAYVDSEVSGLVDSAPGALNTLNELAAAINDDASFSTTITNSIATKLPLGGGTMTGNIVMSGSQTVDGRDLSVDGSKLDGIEAGATADQTASEILTLIKTVDGAGSGLDADTLDGVSSGSFIRSDATDTVSGELTFTNDANFTGDVYISDTGSDSSAGPILDLYRNSSSAADADYLGQIKFQGNNDAGQKIVYSKITGKILDASDGTEDGILEFAFKKGGSNNISGRFRSDSLQLLNGTALHVNGAITCDSTVDGRDVASDGSKLDGIESGATADQTAAEIRTLVGSASDSNVFTDALLSKLNGIASGATNVTNNNQLTNGAGYVTANTQLSNEQVQDIVGGMVSSNTESGITVTYQDSDGTLDFSVTSQTDNNFTNADHSKLDGIEAGATADQSASEILTLIKTVDGAGSGLDADTLDGISSANFLRSDQADTIAGALTIDVNGTDNDATGATLLTLDQYINDISTEYTWIDFTFRDSNSNATPQVKIGAQAQDPTGNQILEGTADFVVQCGVDGNTTTNTMTEMFRCSHEGKITSKHHHPQSDSTFDLGTSSVRWRNVYADTLYGSGANLTNLPSQTDNNFTNADHSKLDGIESGATADQSASEILTLVKTVDGASSGLDADLLDGQHGSYYLNYNNFSNTPTIPTNNNQLTNGAGYITATLTNEQVQDIVGGMVSSNTESGITVTYQDGDGTLDFSVASQTDNNFTNADHSKLDGIESGATADQTASEILSLLVTVDGSGSGLDADTLDGIGSSAFLRSDASDTMTGTLTIGDGSAQTELHIKKADNNVSDHLQFYNGTTRVGEIGCEDSTWLRINQETNKNIYTPRYIRADNGFFVDGTSKGINGSGNFIGGTIAGASDYSTLLRSNANDTATGQITFSKAIIASHGVTGNINSSGISTVSGFTFPSSDGSEDQALVTDGSGQLLFKTLSGGTASSGAATSISTGVTTCTAGQTSYTAPNVFDDGSQETAFSTQVYLNGTKLRVGASNDYQLSAPQTVNFTSGFVKVDDEVEIVVYFGHTLEEELFTATAGQKTFTLSGNLAASKNYKVFLNGIRLRNTVDYTASAAVILTEAADDGDQIDICSDQAEDRLTAVEGQTAFAPSDSNTTSDNLQVYLNGILLRKDKDWSIGSPAVTLLDAHGAKAGDELDVVVRRA